MQLTWSSNVISHVVDQRNIHFDTCVNMPGHSIAIMNELPRHWYHAQGAVSIRKTVLPGMAIPMLKIRRPNGRLIFNMEIAIRR